MPHRSCHCSRLCLVMYVTQLHVPSKIIAPGFVLPRSPMTPRSSHRGSVNVDLRSKSFICCRADRLPSAPDIPCENAHVCGSGFPSWKSQARAEKPTESHRHVLCAAPSVRVDHLLAQGHCAILLVSTSRHARSPPEGIPSPGPRLLTWWPNAVTAHAGRPSCPARPSSALLVAGRLAP